MFQNILASTTYSTWVRGLVHRRSGTRRVPSVPTRAGSQYFFHTCMIDDCIYSNSIMARASAAQAASSSVVVSYVTLQAGTQDDNRGTLEYARVRSAGSNHIERSTAQRRSALVARGPVLPLRSDPSCTGRRSHCSFRLAAATHANPSARAPAACSAASTGAVHAGTYAVEGVLCHGSARNLFSGVSG